MFFDPGSVLLTLLVSGGLMGLAIATSHQAFILGTQQATITKHRPGRSQQNHRFTSGLTQVVLLKEWRIISRNPQLVLGIGFQIVILGVILLRNGLWEDIAGSGLSIAMVGIVLSESLASTFTLICVSAEEAADLLQAAPVEGMEFRRLKLLAALIPTWLLITPLFILLLWQGEPWFFPWLVALGASTCAAVLRLWNARPISLSDLFRKRQTAFNDLLLNIFETISLFTWAWLGFLVVKSWWFFVPLPLLVIAIVVAIAYLRSRQLGTTLGF
jgi:ABC-2 type transport system permease protein